MNIAYECKFCQQPGTLTIYSSELFRIEEIRPMASCNRCADYMVKRRGQNESITRACVFLIQIRQTIKENVRIPMEKEIRQKLVELTQKYAELVCDHVRLENVWDIEFVNMLMGQPNRIQEVIYRYEKGLRGLQPSAPRA